MKSSRNRILCLAASTLFLLMAREAGAHPGHDLAAQGPWHVFTSSYHLTILGGVGIALWSVGYFIKRSVTRRVLQAGGLLALLGAAILWAWPGAGY